MSNRSYTDRELRLTTEWVAAAYPGARVIQRYRINMPPPYIPPGWTLESILALLKPTGFMVDAVVTLPDVTLVVEAKTDNESQAIGQLQFYVYLMRKYAAIQEVRTDALRPVLLYARPSPELEAFASTLGIQVVYYSPDWIQPFLRQGYTGGGVQLSTYAEVVPGMWTVFCYFRAKGGCAGPMLITSDAAIVCQSHAASELGFKVADPSATDSQPEKPIEPIMSGGNTAESPAAPPPP